MTRLPHRSRRSQDLPRWSSALTPLVAALMAVWPLESLAQRAARPVAPPRDAVPVPATTWRVQGSGAAAPQTSSNARGGRDMRVEQTSQRAIYHWQSFDIGADSGVHFQMPNAGSSALNRIARRAAPSAIFGSLTSNGSVTLLNGAGILFGPTAQVNVGSLIASTLNLGDDDFLSGLTNGIYGTAPSFFRDPTHLGVPDVGPGFIEVQAGADLRTAAGGRVFLFAEEVSNAGRISTPQGQTVLAAGERLHLQDPTREALYASEVNPSIPALRGLLVEVEGAGRVRHDGVIDTPRGNATLVGLAVNVAGRISATTSVAENGSVLLLARSGASASFNTTGTLVKQATQGGTLTLEPGASLQITPDATRVDGALPTSSDNASFTRSRVELAGQTITLADDSSVVAPGALLRARAGKPDYNADPLTARTAGVTDPTARITLGDGAVIDVAGTRDTTASVARQFVTTEPLGSNDLKDAPLQKLGPLFGSRVTFDLRRSVPILGSTSAYLQAVERSAGERLANGGEVRLESAGAVVTHERSRIDVSGGQVRFDAAQVQPTLLLAADGSRVSLNDAAADVRYTAIDGVDRYFSARAADGKRTALQDRWGIATRYSAALAERLEPGYTEGRAGGALRITAPQAVLDGALLGQTVQGERQRTGTDALPTASQFMLGRLDNGGSFGSSGFAGTGVETALRLGAAPASLGASFWQAPLDAALPATGSRVAASTLTGAGFGQITLATEADLHTASDATLSLPALGSLSLAARGPQGLTLASSVQAPGGSIQLQTADRSAANGTGNPAGDLTLGAGARLDLAGQVVNVLQDGSSTALPVAGGSAQLRSGAGLVLAPGSHIDVSGGARVSAAGAITGGAAGSITLNSSVAPSANALDGSPFSLQGSLQGLALAGARGGSLSLRAAQVHIGAAATPAAAKPKPRTASCGSRQRSSPRAVLPVSRSTASACWRCRPAPRSHRWPAAGWPTGRCWEPPAASRCRPGPTRPARRWPRRRPRWASAGR